VLALLVYGEWGGRQSMEVRGMRLSGRGRVGALAAALGVLAASLALAACGSNASGTPTPTPTASAATSATAQITTNWQKFFAGATPAATKITLVQDGQVFAKVINAQAKSPLAQSTQAKVTSVKVISPTKATVRYSIVQGGATALPDQAGVAVLENGVWKVSAPSFAALLALEGVKVALPSASP
jgi:hypothetical protein